MQAPSQPTSASAGPDLDSIPVDSVPTPNPDALMFRVSETLVPTGTYEYRDRDDAAAQSPLAARLLALDDVELVLIAPRFVTVRKEGGRKWPELVGGIKLAIRQFLHSGDMAVFDTHLAAPEHGADRTEIEERILELLDEEIRPAIAQDGGDVEFEGFVDGVVKLRLTGACGTCPSSTATLKMGIEALLAEEIPEVESVEQVF